MKTKVARSVVLLPSLAVDILAGLFVTAPFFSNASAQTTAPTSQKAVSSAYPKNAQGQTYGTCPQTAGADVEEPDLMAAVGVDGIKGYVKKTDLEGDVVKSPEEAVALMKRRAKAAKVYEEIPLYESDGQTVIGKFRLSEGNVTTIE